MKFLDDNYEFEGEESEGEEGEEEGKYREF